MAKRRASGEGMLRRRGRRWEARIIIGHAEDGKPIFHHMYEKTRPMLTPREMVAGMDAFIHDKN